MSKDIAFYFDFGSPNSYLAYRRLPGVVERTGARLIWKPMLLGGVFKATGNQSPAATPVMAKRSYMRVDFARFVERYDIDFHFNDAFPLNTITLMRGAIAYLDSDVFDAYAEAIFNAMWVDNVNLGDPSALQETLTAAGFAWDDFQQRVNDPGVKAELKQATDEAVSQHVFGAPTFIVDDALFFGQDRLDFVEERLARG